MGLASIILPGRNSRLLSDLSSQIAIRSHGWAMSLVLENAQNLPLGQARGYIRARSRRVVDLQSRLVFESQPQLEPAMREQILEMALELVVVGATRDVMTARAIRVLRTHLVAA